MCARENRPAASRGLVTVDNYYIIIIYYILLGLQKDCYPDDLDS